MGITGSFSALWISHAFFLLRSRLHVRRYWGRSGRRFPEEEAFPGEEGCQYSFGRVRCPFTVVMQPKDKSDALAELPKLRGVESGVYEPRDRQALTMGAWELRSVKESCRPSKDYFEQPGDCF